MALSLYRLSRYSIHACEKVQRVRRFLEARSRRIILSSYDIIWGSIKKFRGPLGYYTIDGVHWAIFQEGKIIAESINQRCGWNFVRIRERLVHIQSKDLVHLGCEYHLLSCDIEKMKSKGAYIVCNWYHEDIKCMARYRSLSEDKFLEKIQLVDVFICTNKRQSQLLNSWRISKKKIHVIPIGVDMAVFQPCTEAEKRRIRRGLEIPEGALCIGSFQKDGVGWGEGLDPKLIKGPDIFLGVLKRLPERNKLFVLLTGPSRGYVRRGLEALGISYRHDLVRDYSKMVDYYRACDVYLICSRLEGGPKSLLEGMACGIPVVSTSVGMAPDVIQDGHNGFLADPMDEGELVAKLQLVLKNHQILREKIVRQGFVTVRAYSLERMMEKYWVEVYLPYLQKGVHEKAPLLSS